MPHRAQVSTSPKPEFHGPLDWHSLVQWLNEDGVISDDEAQRTIARCSQAESRQHPLVRLASVAMKRAADDKVLDIEMLTQWLATHAGLDYFRIDPLKVDVGKVADAVSAVYAERHRILPVQVTLTELVIASAEPYVTDWVQEVERQSKRRVRRVVSSPLDIVRYTAEFFSLAKSVRQAMKAGAGNNNTASFEQLVELGKANKALDANDQGVVRVVDWLWQYAFDQRASDIHLEPRREQGAIRFRIDGILHRVYQMPMGVHNAITARIKLLGRMDVIEKRRPLDGRIKTRNQQGEEVEMRISTLPTAFGEKMVMRIFDPDTTLKDLDGLGFSLHDAQRWETLVKRPHGIILVTGPTGSGKTTTLYSTLKRLATEEVNVSTVEDPIEMIETAFNQTQVQPQLDFGFTEGLRALMRQDPDIIMVGEIRDAQTADMAVQAALTGHLVFSTLHTNDAPGAITRIGMMGIEPFLTSSTLLMVVAQRLVRSICRNCKETYEVKPELLVSLGVSKSILDNHIKNGKIILSRGRGCDLCAKTGYKGRTGIHEILEINDAIRGLIIEKAHVSRVKEAGRKNGMITLRESALRKLFTGMTTVEEVIRVTGSDVD